MKRHILSIIPMLVLGFPAVAAADLDALIEDCDGCHGKGGVSEWSDMPTIAGLGEFVIADNLYIYQDEARPCAESEYRIGDTSRPPTDMCKAVADLSDDDIEALAVHYGNMDWVKAKQEFDAELAAVGEEIHMQNCDRCHSDAGTNLDDEASMLGGQQMGYLRSTFEEYAAETRDQPKKMKDKLDALSADEIEALVHYYGSIQ
ncbi:MAG: c-type cytochrome [Woeseiaceae bacterium]|nr:c-type cytochrome [Woeseiaceae bacterium]